MSHSQLHIVTRAFICLKKGIEKGMKWIKCIAECKPQLKPDSETLEGSSIVALRNIADLVYQSC